MQTKIKICGLTTKEDIQSVNQGKITYAGFVFFEKSKRNLTYAQYEELIRDLDPSIQKVAVVVSPTLEEIEHYNTFDIDILQIHGNCDRSCIDKSRHPIWQAVNIQKIQEADARFIEAEQIQGYVIDAAEYGSGKTFEWRKEQAEQIRELTKGKQFILAGGLHAKNVQQGITIFHPDVVDVSSGVEHEGKLGKDKKKIESFIRKVREYATE